MATKHTKRLSRFGSTVNLKQSGSSEFENDDWGRHPTPTAKHSLTQELIDRSIHLEELPEKKREKSIIIASGAKGFLQNLTKQDSIEGAAFGRLNGNVDYATGDLEADTVCAATSLMRSSLSEAVEFLGLGELQQWCVGGKERTWYVRNHGDWFIVAVGISARRPGLMLCKLFARLERKGRE